MAVMHMDLGAADSIPPPHGSPYGVPLLGTEQKDRSAVYRHWRYKDTALLDTYNPLIRTAFETFEETANRLPRNQCLGYRPWDSTKKIFENFVWEDYGTIQRRRAYFGMGLVELHRQVGITGRQYGIGLWCFNRPEWQISDLGAQSQSLYTVSLYDTLGPTAVEYIARHSNLACIVTSLNHIPTLLSLKSTLPELKIIISADELEAGDQPGHSKLDLLNGFAQAQGVIIRSLKAVEAIGEAQGAIKYNPPSPDDIVVINYTSGTTGVPKGVVLTNRAAVAASSASLGTIATGPGDVGLSYLPLAHIYGRLCEQTTLWTGGSIGYFHGNVLELVDDLKLIRPTTFISVPRLYNRFGGAIRAATVEATGFRGSMARHIVNTKLEALKDPESAGATNKHAFYDRIWGRKVGAAIGLDRVKHMVTGSAPLDPSLHQFLRVCLGNNFVQGYGLTETYACGLAQLPGDMTTGNCGAPNPATEFCLLSVPDMEYLATDQPFPRGELLVRGTCLFSGYFKDEAETAKAMTVDGWFKTGDIATVDGMGRFKIVDRRKNVLKLAQGEYISPERLENVYLSHLPYLAQAFVHGDSSQTFLVAVFGVMPDLFADKAGKILGRTIAKDDFAAIRAAAASERVVAAVQKDLDGVGRKNKFAGYERVKAVKLELEPFSVENEMLTPTLKLKRPQAAKKFRDTLDRLYEQGLAAEKAGKGMARL